MNALSQLRRRGFGVALSVITAIIISAKSIEITMFLLRLYGHAICGNYLEAIWQTFYFAGMLIVVPLIGWKMAQRARYGARIAFSCVVAAFVTWLICFAVLRIPID